MRLFASPGLLLPCMASGWASHAMRHFIVVELRVGRAVVTRAVQEETARAEEKTKRLNKAATTIQRAWRTYHAAKGGGAKGGGKAEKAEKKGGKKKK